MASIRRRNGRYQAQVRIGAVSKSASFSSKAEARAWAAGEEAALFSSFKVSLCVHTCCTRTPVKLESPCQY